MYKVVVTHNIPGNGLAELRKTCEVITPPEGQIAFSREEIKKQLSDADAVLACAAIDREMIEGAPKLKIISNYGAGYDRIDVAAAKEHNIPVTNIPDATMSGTAELTFAIMISLLRRVTAQDRAIRRGDQGLFVMGNNMGHSLFGKKLGIVGMGHIGGMLADMAKAFGMQVAYFNRHELAPEKAHGAKYLSLEALLAESDIVSFNCPLNDSTRGLLSRERIALMKDGAFIVNTSRGGVLDYDALIDALNSGKLAGAALDVFPQEPKVPEALLTMENVVLTPHQGTNTHEDRENMAKACAERILLALDGVTPPNVVNGVTL